MLAPQIHHGSVLAGPRHTHGKRITRDTERTRGEFKRDEALAAPLTLSDEKLRSMKAVVARDADNQALQQCLRRRGVTRVHRRVDANMFITNSPGKLGIRDRCIAVLVGAYVCSPSVLLAGSGVAMLYKAAFASRRELWISPSFKDRHAAVCACISGARANFRRPQISIMKEESRQAFVNQRARAVRAGKRTSVLALVAKTELQAHHFCRNPKQNACHHINHHMYYVSQAKRPPGARDGRGKDGLRY